MNFNTMIDRNPIDEALFAEVSRLEWDRVERDVRAAVLNAQVFNELNVIVSDNLERVIYENLEASFVRGFLKNNEL